MLDLKGTIPTHWLQSFHKKKILCSLISLGGLLLPSIALASYAPVIQNPNDGYLIQLASNSSIASTPVVGSDGKNYYRVGSPIVIDDSDSSVTVTGNVKCIGRIWGDGNIEIGSDSAYHRLFIYAPEAGTLDGKKSYRINSNVVMTVESKMPNWVNIGADACSNVVFIDWAQPASGFRAQFPITVTFYINERIIDGQIVIPSMPLGGYVRAFMSPKTPPTFTSWPLDEVTVPIRLRSSTLNVGSSCNTTTTTGQAGTVNLRHGQLNTSNYDSVVTEKVTYNCKFSMPTTVNLLLDYATDDDPQKRLPMTSSQNNKIYSDLSMTDEITGQTGKEFQVNIKDLRTIKITSHIQGSNAVAGDYKGSAWLIATFD
ncbi:adhesin [Providencia sp. PROV120]|uniref:adhesin n=1 Tax=Providencia sp. PROV120 TaxID=2949831 RepID=UPI00234B5C25|nr:adhesin [Providencia sp. PROV120]